MLYWVYLIIGYESHFVEMIDRESPTGERTPGSKFRSKIELSDFDCVSNCFNALRNIPIHTIESRSIYTILEGKITLEYLIFCALTP